MSGVDGIKYESAYNTTKNTRVDSIKNMDYELLQASNEYTQMINTCVEDTSMEIVGLKWSIIVEKTDLAERSKVSETYPNIDGYIKTFCDNNSDENGNQIYKTKEVRSCIIQVLNGLNEMSGSNHGWITEEFIFSKAINLLLQKKWQQVDVRTINVALNFNTSIEDARETIRLGEDQYMTSSKWKTTTEFINTVKSFRLNRTGLKFKSFVEKFHPQPSIDETTEWKEEIKGEDLPEGIINQEILDVTEDKLRNELNDLIYNDAYIQDILKSDGRITINSLREILKENTELYNALRIYFEVKNFNSWINDNYDKDPELLLKRFNDYLFNEHSFKVDKLYFSISEYLIRDSKFESRRLARLKRRNSEINSRRINVQTKERQSTSYTWNNKVSDIQNASWTQIIEEAKIWEQLVKYDDTHIDDDVPNERKVQFREEQLPIVRQNFVDQHNEIKDLIILDKFMKIYDPENNTINFSLDPICDSSLDDKQNLRLRLGFWENVDIDHIYWILMSFPDEMENTVKELSEDYVSEQEQANNDKRINTAWFVLDNIKSLFEGFTYDEKYPVTLDVDKDMLIIKGSIKWSEIEGSWNTWAKTKICYDLKSGILYMNSFVKESYIPPVITIWERWNKSEDYPEADTEIWPIGSFDEILSYNDTFNEDEINRDEDDYKDNINTSPNNIHGPRNFMYGRSNMMQDNNNWPVGEDIEGMRRREQNSQSIPVVPPRPWQYPIPWRFPRPNIQAPLNSYESNPTEKNLKLKNKINTAIDLIGKEVKEYSKIQAKRNEVIINFLRTFNIIKDGESIKNMQFHEGSNLYSILRIIQNSDYNQLDSFSAFMTTISKCSWLQRWRNTLPEQQRNKCYKEIMDADIYNKNSARSCLKEGLMNFKSETDNLSDPHNLNFDYKRNLWMAQLIINNIIDNPNSNNSSSANISKCEFDVIKIKDFLTSLNTGEQMKFNKWSNESFAEKDPDEELDEKLNLYNI